ncbi:MAG: hypothetical protein ABI633_05335 [Burkholderiales bacterium]
MTTRQIIAATLVSLSSGAMAQTVYESKDKSGPVFSDMPSAGASAVQLQAPNVISMPAPAPVQTPTKQAPPAYRDFVILAPEGQGSVHSNTGAFDVKARLSPALRSSDRIAVSIDGSLLKKRFRSPNIHIADADWRSASDDESVAHSLQLVVVDAKGALLIESAPVNFYMHRATVSRRRR